MFRLRVLGGFALEGPSGASVPPLPQRRAKAVLAVLAVCGDLGCTRERLLALLWPESDEAHSRHGLSDVLGAIRHAVGLDAVVSSGDLLHLDPAVIASDVLAFTQAVAAGRHADAAQAFGGGLLEGFHVDDAPEFERWLDGERTRLARQCAEALEHLAVAAERAGAWGEAAGWWARAEEHDPLNSHFALRHAQALAAIGDRANAIKVADAHARRLRRELEMEPDPEVLAAIERIRSGEIPAPDLRPPVAGAAGDRPRAPVPTHPPADRPATSVADAAAPIPSPKRMPRWIPWTAGIAVVAVALIIGLGRRRTPESASPRPPRTAIAVLPFRNLSADTAHAFFASGLHEELLTQLAKVAALRVIGRTSVAEYERTSKSLRQIGVELGVGSIVEGSVQVERGRLRVTVQLIDAATQSHIWAERYDSTPDNAFAVQSEIARRVVAAVGATLTSEEAGAITAAPTQNAEAYQLYLQALDYFRRPGYLRQNLEIAQHLFERALALDSTFALAHLGLSSVHWWYGAYDPYGAGPGLYHRELAAALRFAPQLPQARLAVIMEPFWKFHDYRTTLNELGTLVRSAPNDADLWGTIAQLYTGLGYWDSVDVAFEHASGLDPRNANLFFDRGDALKCRRRYGEAIAAYRRALLLAPDYINLRIQLAWTYYMWKGELDTIRAVLRGLPDGDPGGGSPGPGAELAFVLLFDRRPDSVLSLLRANPRILTNPTTYVPRTLLAAWAHRMKGDSAAARAAFDSARALVDSLARGQPSAWVLHAWRGHVLAGLGRHEDALREARWLEQFESSNRVYNYCSYAPVVRAEILVANGDTEVALTAIERLLVGPSGVTVPALRVDPRFDPIRGNPRFQALLKKYRDPISY